MNEKIAAAQELDISIIIIKRPDMHYPALFSDQNKMVDHILNDK